MTLVKKSGVKLHIGVDVLGLPNMMAVSTATISDRDGALKMIGYAGEALSKCLKVLVDGGYTGENFANGVRNLIGADVEVVKRNELLSFPILQAREKGELN